MIKIMLTRLILGEDSLYWEDDEAVENELRFYSIYVRKTLILERLHTRNLLRSAKFGVNS
jgi:hypothetical protein